MNRKTAVGLSLLLLLVIPVFAVGIGPNLVQNFHGNLASSTTSTSNFDVGGSQQRFTFNAVGDEWLFYYTASGGYAWIMFTCSQDGVTWTTPQTIERGIGSGDFFGVAFDGTYFQYIGSPVLGSFDYGRETPYSNCTMAQSAIQTVSGISGRVYNPVIATDVNGYPMFTYTDCIFCSSESVWIARSSTNNGVFTLASGYPLLLETFNGTNLSSARGVPIALDDSAKIAVVWGNTNLPLRLKVYDVASSTWGSTIYTTNQLGSSGEQMSVTAYDGMMRVAFENGNTIYFAQYNVTSSTLKESTPVAGIGDVPQMTQYCNKTYLFWMNPNSGVSTIYYKELPLTSTTWSDTHTWLSDAYQQAVFSNWLYSVPSTDNSIGLMFTVSNGVNDTLRYANLPLPLCD